MVRELKTENMEDKEFIRHLKGELFSAEDDMLTEKDQLVRAQLQVELLTSQVGSMKWYDIYSTFNTHPHTPLPLLSPLSQIVLLTAVDVGWMIARLSHTSNLNHCCVMGL